MEKIFLSYTYNPHPDYKQETDELVKNFKIIAESQEIQVYTGVDLGGNRVSSAIKQRIKDCDALVALITPWKDAYNNPAIPPFVNDEYTFAIDNDKEAIRLWHTTLPIQGMNPDLEYISFDPNQQIDALFKLMRTLVLWKKKIGRSHEIQFLPAELVRKLNIGDANSCCEYQLLINRRPSEWKKIEIWPEPGGLVTYIPNVPDGAKLNLKVTFGDEQWHSNFYNPQNHSVTLEKLS